MNDTIELLGLTLERAEQPPQASHVSWYGKVGRYDVELAATLIRHAAESYSLGVSRRFPDSDDGPVRTINVTIWSARTPRDAADGWLAAASYDCPRLCALVVDGMADCPTCYGHGVHGHDGELDCECPAGVAITEAAGDEYQAAQAAARRAYVENYEPSERDLEAMNEPSPLVMRDSLAHYGERV